MGSAEHLLFKYLGHCAFGISIEENNRNFYDSAPASWLTDLSEDKGLAKGEDLDALRASIEPFLKNESRVLEIGAGRGRVIQWVIDHFPKVKVVALDQSRTTIDRLEKEFGRNSQIDLINRSLLHFSSKKPFNLILWMWSGFAEISSENKPKALRLLHALLDSDGCLVIDLPVEISGGTPVVMGVQGIVTIPEPFGTLQAHLVNEAELKTMALSVGFSNVEAKHYVTSTAIPRVSYLIKK